MYYAIKFGASQFSRLDVRGEIVLVAQSAALITYKFKGSRPRLLLAFNRRDVLPLSGGD